MSYICAIESFLWSLYNIFILKSFTLATFTCTRKVLYWMNWIIWLTEKKWNTLVMTMTHLFSYFVLQSKSCWCRWSFFKFKVFCCFAKILFWNENERNASSLQKRHNLVKFETWFRRQQCELSNPEDIYTSALSIAIWRSLFICDFDILQTKGRQ